jgi:hypothetical protein
MKKGDVKMKIKKRFENEVFIIDEKDSELFERAKEQSDDIYFLIENLEFLQVDFVIESDLKEAIINYWNGLKIKEVK